MARPKALTFTGTYRDSGDGRGPQPKAFFNGVPARDLDESDIAALSDAELSNIMGGPTPLYVDPDAKQKEPTLAELREQAEALGHEIPKRPTKAQLTKLIESGPVEIRRENVLPGEPLFGAEPQTVNEADAEVDAGDQEVVGADNEP